MIGLFFLGVPVSILVLYFLLSHIDDGRNVNEKGEE